MWLCMKRSMKVFPSNSIRIDNKMIKFYNELTMMEKENSQYNSSFLLNIQSVLDCISLVYNQRYIKNNYTYDYFKDLLEWIEQYESNSLKEMKLKKEVQDFYYNVMESNDIEHVLIINNKLIQKMNKNKKCNINCSVI